jgi:hypothetical protein
MCGRADGITIAHTTITTSNLSTERESQDQQVSLLTASLYTSYIEYLHEAFSLTITRDLIIAYKVTKLLKFLKFVEICGTSDPEGALS